jgi:catechol 2,3-dioxygenase-like lactoylglutathione lyase family enzyme
MSIDHITCTVSDFERSKAFYQHALAPLGIKVMMEFGPSAGFGKTKPDFWVAGGPASFQTAEQLKLITPIHVAFQAASTAEVDAFYEAAVAHGGKSFGAPGLRAHYHPGYYGAFVLDPDGHNVEAVFHGATG